MNLDDQIKAAELHLQQLNANKADWEEMQFLNNGLHEDMVHWDSRFTLGIKTPKGRITIECSDLGNYMKQLELASRNYHENYRIFCQGE